MINNFKILYAKNPVMFKRVGLFLILHFISIGLVMPYTTLIQLRFISLNRLLLLNGIGFLIGSMILYGFISGKLQVIDVRRRLIFFKGLLMTGRLSILLLLLFSDSTFNWILLVLSVFCGTISYPVINSDYQFLMFKSYGLKNRVRLTSANTVVMSVSIIIMNFVSSLIYPRLYIVYLIAVIMDLTAILSLTRFTGDYSYKAIGKIKETFSKAELEVFTVMLMLQISFVMLIFIRPVVFKNLGEEFVGFLFGTALILNAFITHYFLHSITNRKPFIKTSIISVVLGTIMILSLSSSILQTVALLITIPFINTMVFGFRHIIFKNTDKELTWSVSAINELLKGISYSIFIPLGLIKNLSYVGIMVFSMIILFIVGVVSIHLSGKTHHKAICE